MSNGGNRTRGVATHSRQRFKLLDIVRNHATVFINDGHRRSVEQSSPAVIAKPLPRGNHRVFSSFSHRFRGRKSGHEALEHLRHPTSLRLLKHQFTDQASPPVTGVSPRKGSRNGRKPPLDRGRHRLRQGQRRRFGRGSRHCLVPLGPAGRPCRDLHPCSIRMVTLQGRPCPCSVECSCSTVGSQPGGASSRQTPIGA